jgi:hypothetical protein
MRKKIHYFVYEELVDLYAFERVAPDKVIGSEKFINKKKWNVEP